MQGAATEDSDIDLLIDTTGTNIKSLLQVAAVYCELEEALGKPGGSGHCQLTGTGSADAKRGELPKDSLERKGGYLCCSLTGSGWNTSAIIVLRSKKTITRYGESFGAFDSDADYQRSVSFCILQIGELSGGLSAEFRKATADRIQWGPIKGMRNLVAHSYGSMSRDIIWETAVTDIPVLQEFCEQQLMVEDQK